MYTHKNMSTCPKKNNSTKNKLYLLGVGLQLALYLYKISIRDIVTQVIFYLWHIKLHLDKEKPFLHMNEIICL